MVDYYQKRNIVMSDILTDKQKMVGMTSGGSGVLARLWRTIFLDLDIGPIKFGKLLEEYVTTASNGIPNNRKEQVSYRGNLIKEFAKSQMTWRIFIKALRFLNITRIEITLVATHFNTTTTTHKTSLYLGSRHDNIGFNTSLNQPEDKEVVQPVPCLDLALKEKSFVSNMYDNKEEK